jgi:hypothetical protein
MESNTPTFKMTEAELIRELASLEPRVREMVDSINESTQCDTLIQLVRARLRARMLRDELESRTLSACV